MNERRERIGAVFVRGPNVIEVRADGVATLIDYIHRNPERAGVVSDPYKSSWTSQCAYARLGHSPKWLDVDRGLELAGMTRDDFRRWAVTANTDANALEKFRARPARTRGRPRFEPSLASEIYERQSARRVNRLRRSRSITITLSDVTTRLPGP